jgi:hypothetical protein
MKGFLFKYWWFFVLLLIASFYLFSNLKTGTLKSKEIKFSISKAERITKVTINNQSDSLTIVKSNNDWLVNKKVIACSEPINVLLMALSQLRAASPIPLSVSDSLINILQHDGLHVQVYSGRRKIRDFHLYSTQTLDLRTIGMLNSASLGHRLELPGYQCDIINIFSTRESFWVDKKLMIPDVNNMLAVNVEIPQKPELSYRIDIDNDRKYKLYALLQGEPAFQFDTLRAEQYLRYLNQMASKLEMSGMTNDAKASITSMEPDFVIKIYPRVGEPTILRIIPIPIEEYLDEFGRTVNFDLNRLYLAINYEPDIYVVPYVEIHPVLKDIFHFNPKFH